MTAASVASICARRRGSSVETFRADPVPEFAPTPEQPNALVRVPPASRSTQSEMTRQRSVRAAPLWVIVRKTRIRGSSPLRPPPPPPVRASAEPPRPRSWRERRSISRDRKYQLERVLCTPTWRGATRDRVLIDAWARATSEHRASEGRVTRSEATPRGPSCERVVGGTARAWPDAHSSEIARGARRRPAPVRPRQPSACAGPRHLATSFVWLSRDT